MRLIPLTPKLTEALVINDEEESLFNEIRQNPMAFTILYRHYLPRIYRYLYLKTAIRMTQKSSPPRCFWLHWKQFLV